MITLYDCPFSPFARKVRMVLEFKRLEYASIDALSTAHREALETVNPRREVPVLTDGDIVVANSAHIVAYLEDAYPDPPIYPLSPRERAAARHWERMADIVLDPIVTDISLWSWANRPDAPPAGLHEAAQRDLDKLYRDLESVLETGQDFICGELSVADIALFPNLYSTRALGVRIDAARFPKLAAWLDRMSRLPLMQDDLNRLRTWLKNLDRSNYENDKIVWRGERIEWILSAGFSDWFFNEVREGRVLWPGR